MLNHVTFFSASGDLASCGGARGQRQPGAGRGAAAPGGSGSWGRGGPASTAAGGAAAPEGSGAWGPGHGRQL